jgi:hypothetical protein
MKTGPRWFNFYLILAMTVLLAGCASTKDPTDKYATMLRMHLESQPNQMIPPRTIAVYRSDPLVVQIESLHLVTEENVVEARVVDQHGTYAIQIQFDQWAIPLLEHNSSSWQGRRLAIQAQWGPDYKWGRNYEHTRWLAAPKMNRKITDGTVTFTPDATREETYEIVAGLNNQARKVKKQLEW